MSRKKPTIFATTFARFTGTDIIGQGGAGRIFLATDETGNEYATKLLNSDNAKGIHAKRFKNEILFCSKNQHPNILTIIDHGVLLEGEKRFPFYVMPRYTSSLKRLLETGILHSKVLFYFGQLLYGVEAAHLQQVTHRDLKPDNVLYDEKQDRLLIADFGIARFEEEALYTSVETVPGTRLANFHYAAPEQRSRGAVVDHRADIYALGLILNEMFTGQVPQGTGYTTIGSVASEYEYLDELVATMLRQSAEERPASIEIIKRELIGRKQESITLQRLSKLKETVVPITESDEPLVVDPPRLVDIDVEPGKLILLLQYHVTDKWIQAWQEMGRTASYRFLDGKRPDRVTFSGNKAVIAAQESEIQHTVDLFKEWLPLANRTYAAMLSREKQAAVHQHRQQLQNEIEEIERRRRIRARIKI